MKKIAILAVSIVIASLCLAACKGKDDQSSAQQDKSSVNSSQTQGSGSQDQD